MLQVKKSALADLTSSANKSTIPAKRNCIKGRQSKPDVAESVQKKKRELAATALGEPKTVRPLEKE